MSRSERSSVTTWSRWASVALAVFSLGVATPVAGQDQAATVFFSGVRLVDPRLPMGAEFPVRSVLVREGQIESVGDSGELAPPPGALVVDGGDTLFLSPGLVDAHVHLEFEPAGWMTAFLGYGVTTVFNLRGSPVHLELRRAVREGRVAGPEIVTAGPYTNLPTIRIPDEAREAVARQRSEGFDLVKIHGELDRHSYEALLRAGDSLAIPVGGHLPRNLPAHLAIQLGQDWVAHAEEFVYTDFSGFDTTGVGAFVRGMSERGVWLTPGLITFRRIADQWGRPEAADSVLALPAARAVPERARRVWSAANSYTRRPTDTSEWARRAFDFQVAFTGAAAKAGVRFLLGTDTPLPVMIPGASLLEEMEEMAAAGVSPGEVFHAATLGPALFLAERAPRTPHRFGIVEPGMLARIVLVGHDPREHFRTFENPVGVMTAGRWYDRRTLEGFRNGERTEEGSTRGGIDRPEAERGGPGSPTGPTGT